MKMIGFTRLRCPAAAAMMMLVVVLCVPNVRASDDTLIELGDYLQLLIPAAGLAGTYVADDPEGRIQFWQTWGSSIAITSVGKFAFSKLRPNLSDKRHIVSLRTHHLRVCRCRLHLRALRAAVRFDGSTDRLQPHRG